MRKGQSSSPFLCWSDGPWRKATAAIRADVVQACFNALATECAFIGADPSCHGMGRKIDVAKLAVGSEIECHFLSVQPAGIALNVPDPSQHCPS